MKKHLHNIAKDLDRVTDAASLKEVAREIVTKRRRYQAFESFFESHMDETGLSSDPTLRMMQINRQRRKLEDEFNQLQQSAA
jgi:chromosome condensin MukBEF ATPase and DNA-binding subunit MukB